MAGKARSGLTGGCQCGAVRYRLDSAPSGATICHCRMCQKAGGAPFMVFAGVGHDAFVVTHGQISKFVSSEIAERGFCASCGTPLTWEGKGADHISFTTGSLDEPNAIEIIGQLGIESRAPWLDEAFATPGTKTEDWLKKKHIADIGNHQYPDRD